MAQVAFMIQRTPSVAETTNRITAITKDFTKDKSYDAVFRCDITKAEAEVAGIVPQLFERIKVEVTTLSDVLALTERKDFVRFCCGGHQTIHHLIAARKAEGRSDWYA